MLKGHKFAEDDLAPGDRAAMSAEDKAAWCEEQTKRYTPVSIDENASNEGDRLIIAEELNQRIVLSHPEDIRRQVATLMGTRDPEMRARVLAAFNADGSLKSPFKAV